MSREIAEAHLTEATGLVTEVRDLVVGSGPENPLITPFMELALINVQAAQVQATFALTEAVEKLVDLGVTYNVTNTFQTEQVDTVPTEQEKVFVPGDRVRLEPKDPIHFRWIGLEAEVIEVVNGMGYYLRPLGTRPDGFTTDFWWDREDLVRVT
jgi:hypothetical protein